MMLFKKGAALLLIVVFCLSAGGLSAQEDLVRVIPATAMIPCARLSPDGQTVVIFDDGNFHEDYEVDPLYLPLHLLDLNTGAERLLTGHIDYATDAVFTLDSSRLISYHGNGVILIWDVTSGEVVKEIPAIPEYARLLLLPDGKTLAVQLNSPVAQVWLWDIETGFITSILTDRSASRGEVLNRSSSGLYEKMLTFAVSPDGTQMATVSVVGRILLWEISTGQARVLLEGPQGEEDISYINIPYIQFAPDGETLMYYEIDEELFYFVNTADSSEIQTIPAAHNAHVAISADWNRIAWVAPDANILVVADMAQLDQPALIGLPPTDLDFAPRLASTLFFAGDRLVFSGFFNQDGENQIYVIDLPS